MEHVDGRWRLVSDLVGERMDVSHLVSEFAPWGFLEGGGGIGKPEGQSHNSRSLSSRLREIKIGGWSALNKGVQSQFGDGEAISKLVTNLIDGCDQIIAVDLPPLVARKQAAGC